MKSYVALLSAISFLLAGCTKAKETLAPSEKDTVALNIHGVNYTADPFRYVIVDPKDPSNRGGGEHLAPYSGGGITCCYTLPKKWAPGIQAKVLSTHWIEKKDTGKLTTVETEHLVDVPAYPNGKAGEVWVMRTAEGGVDLVMSEVEPDHPEWPGKVKGWPEPSLAYQRERWELYRKLAIGDVDTFRTLLAELRVQKEAHLQRTWNFDMEYSRDEVKSFSGPTDPAYATYKKKDYLDGLKRSEEQLQQLLKEKP